MPFFKDNTKKQLFLNMKLFIYHNNHCKSCLFTYNTSFKKWIIQVPNRVQFEWEGLEPEVTWYYSEPRPWSEPLATWLVGQPFS